MNIEEILEKLCAADGVSGNEYNACAAAADILKEYTADITIDKFGCVTAAVGEFDEKKPTALLEAHIDEIGFIVTFIDEKGFIKFGNVGGTDRRLYAAQSVTIHTDKGKLRGVVCTLPPHVAKDNKTAMKTEDAAIDAGFGSKEEALKFIAPGDRITIDAPLRQLCGTRYTGKAIDDRAGAAAVLYALELLKGRKTLFNVKIAFSSQEELGARGAHITAYNSGAAVALATDVSFAYTPDEKKEQCGEMGKGAMIGISPVLDRVLSNELKDIAQRNNIPYQLEIMSEETGTDADVISVTKGGIRTALISIPIKYMHTPVEVVDIEDIKAAGRLMAEYLTGTDI